MGVQETRGPCSRATPLAWTLGGPAFNVEFARGLVFTPAFPCGTLTTIAGVATTRLERIAWWQGTVGDPSCPGGLALVRGHVQKSQRARPQPGTAFRAFGPCEPQTSAENLVKLAIAADGYPGWIIFDSDSQVLVPAGHVVLEVLAPVGWRTLGVVPATVPDWADIALKVYACPAPCGAVWPGQLTEWLPFNGENPPIAADRMLIKPQRARELEVSSEGVGALRVLAHNEPTGTAPLSTVAIAPQGQQRWDSWGAPYLEVASNQQTTAHLRWGLTTP